MGAAGSFGLRWLGHASWLTEAAASLRGCGPLRGWLAPQASGWRTWGCHWDVQLLCGNTPGLVSKLAWLTRRRGSACGWDLPSWG